MAEDVKELLVRVSATTELLRSNLIAAEKAVSDFENKTNAKLGKVDSKFDAIGNGLQRLNGKFAAAAAAAGGFVAAIGISGIGAATARALDYASSLGEVAQQLGVTTKDLQEYRYAASQAGISQEEMDKALAKLTVNIGKAATGGKAQAEAFNALGISVKDANGNIRTAGEIIPEIADKLAQVKDPATRAAVEIELFGKSGQKLDTLLAGGSSAINELTRAANDLGVVLSPELIARADEAADKMAALRQVLEAKLAGVVSENASAITRLADAVAYFLNVTGQGFNDIGNSRNLGALFSGRVPMGERKQAATALLSDSSGRAALEDEVVRRIEANTKARQKATGEEAAALDAEFKALNRIRNQVIAANRRAAGPVRVSAASGGSLDLSDFSASGGGGGGSKGKAAEDPVAKMLSSVDVAIRNSTASAQELYKVIGVQEDDLLKRQLERIENVAKAEYDERLDVIERLNDEGQAKVQTLARLFEDGFRGGVGAVWKDFESIGLQVISVLLAKMVVNGGFGSGGFGGALSAAFSNVLGFADGGSPPVGRVSVVGERGPELFVPKVPGMIVPNHALGGQQTVLNMTINAPGATAETVARIRAEIAMAAQPLIAAATQNTMRTMTRKRLP